MNYSLSNGWLETFNNESFYMQLGTLVIYILVSIWFIVFCIKQTEKYNIDYLYDFFKIKSDLNKGKIRNVSTKDVYLNPLQAGFIITKDIRIHHIIATILHFLNLGIIKLEKIRRQDNTFAYRFSKNEMKFCNCHLYDCKKMTNEDWKELQERGISISEIWLIDRIVFRYYNHINADRIFELYDSKDDISKLYNLRKIDERKELRYDLAKVTAHLHNEFETLGLYNYKSSIHLMLGIWPTKLYFQVMSKLHIYKNKLQFETLLSERSIENIYLWGEHFIYGVAFNICKAAIKDAINIYEGKRKK